MKSISIGNVSVPLAEYAIGACAVLGIRDSGKTVTSKGIAEQLLDNGIPIIVFDAVGKWRWMKVPGEGDRGKAYKVVVAGGREPDLPLSPHSTPEIVRAALRERIPLIIDLFSKELSKSDWRKIVQTAIHIIHYENEGGAVHVFLEEAAEFVPQKVYDGETYAEVEKLVRMGGNASVGITLINQRSQEINKAVLDNCSTALVLGCQVGKNAIEAVEKWIDRLDPETADEVTKSLPKLQSGEAWVWTRKSLDHPTREKMPMCRSLHPDRRTPETVIKAKATDTAEFVAKLAATIPQVIENAKANDPAELKRTISDLKRKLAAAEQKQPEVKQKTVEVPILSDKDRELLDYSIAHAEAQIAAQENTIGQLNAFATELRALRGQLTVVIKNADNEALRRTKPETMRRVREVLRAPATNGHISEVSGGLRRMLIALAQRPGLSKRQLGVRAGLSSTSGTFGTYLARLRSNGWVEDSGDSFNITQQGLSALGHYDPLPEGQDLLGYWLGELGGGAARMLGVLSEVYPKALSKEELGQQAEISHTSGTFGTYLAKLRTLELVEGRQEIRASREFFE